MSIIDLMNADAERMRKKLIRHKPWLRSLRFFTMLLKRKRIRFPKNMGAIR